MQRTIIIHLLKYKLLYIYTYICQFVKIHGCRNMFVSLSRSTIVRQRPSSCSHTDISPLSQSGGISRLIGWKVDGLLRTDILPETRPNIYMKLYCVLRRNWDFFMVKINNEIYTSQKTSILIKSTKSQHRNNEIKSGKLKCHNVFYMGKQETPNMERNRTRMAQI